MTTNFVFRLKLLQKNEQKSKKLDNIYLSVSIKFMKQSFKSNNYKLHWPINDRNWIIKMKKPIWNLNKWFTINKKQRKNELVHKNYKLFSRFVWSKMNSIEFCFRETIEYLVETTRTNCRKTKSCHGRFGQSRTGCNRSSTRFEW